MKSKKTYKSLTELSADSIGAVNAETEKAKSPERHLDKETPPRIPQQRLSGASEVRGYQGWGINE